MKDFELTGFVNFPHHSAKSIGSVDSGGTLVYLIAFDEETSNMNQELIPVGVFSGDDITPKSNLYTPGKSIENIIKEVSQFQVETLNFYFEDGSRPFPVNSAVLIGWSKYTYEYKDRVDPWCCTFRDLTNEGKKLYYSLKKLHNDSEIRLLTFKNVIK